MPRLIFPSLVALFALLSSCKPQEKNGALGTFNFGERAQVGPLIYTVIDSQWSSSLGQDPAPRIPAARFLVMNLTIVNGGTSEQSVPTFAIEDDKGATFTELENGEGIPDWIGFGRKILPAESISGNIAFDVTPKHYKLKLNDDNLNIFAWIDVPLSFGAPPVQPPDPGPAPIKR